VVRRLPAPSLRCIRVLICLSSCIQNWLEKEIYNQWKKSTNNRPTRAWNSYMKQRKELPWLHYSYTARMNHHPWLRCLMHRNKVDKLRGQDSNIYSNVIYLELQQPINDHSYRRFGLTKECTSSINFNSITDLACL
jgi:hypothetical protein